ncbi:MULTISPECIES: hypothetical protein [Serratia]|jgi:hypothetical protein|uniref:hypothetical protein n=1 Tax=Serratia TaxID=613 RepID=UPI000A46A753|nr:MULTISPECIES: hypothetical protein [Serratia]MBH3241602.1 hypothetical protein [Serratia marcescens]MBN5411145.1 hypothetical protein [Serratia marcescens]PIJ08601.1 hypothetical protein BVV00_12150 [Serratia sp. OMLW3]PIJ20503.1 hypothetical protein BVU99_02600 [Serratia sp. OLAL2]UJA52483.1 hypothetical protein L1F17_15885 [Serratia marcescens]
MKGQAQRKVNEVNQPRSQVRVGRHAGRSTSENRATELALEYITKNGIKPRMTLKEFAEFFKMPLEQVQSDARRNYLPLMPRTTPGRRELLQVNMVAYYAHSLAASGNYIANATAFQ